MKLKWFLMIDDLLLFIFAVTLSLLLFYNFGYLKIFILYNLTNLIRTPRYMVDTSLRKSKYSGIKKGFALELAER